MNGRPRILDPSNKFFLPQKRRPPSETRASLRGQGKFTRNRPAGPNRRAAAPAVPVSGKDGRSPDFAGDSLQPDPLMGGA